MKFGNIEAPGSW